MPACLHCEASSPDGSIVHRAARTAAKARYGRSIPAAAMLVGGGTTCGHRGEHGAGHVCLTYGLADTGAPRCNSEAAIAALCVRGHDRDLRRLRTLVEF